MSGLFDKKKTLAELEQEKEYTEAEISVLEKAVMKKELEARGASIESFKDGRGNTMWARVKNWLKTQ